jgi:hypothetical protein
MAFQTGNNVSVRYKVQSGLGSAASGSGGKELPLIASGGLVPAKAAIESPEVRADGMTAIGRHGSRSVGGEYAAVMRVGAVDELIEAAVRGTWVAAASITESTMTSITTTTTTIVAAAGSWITQGVRAGDVIRLADHSTAGNNGKNIPVVSVSASTITVPSGYLTADATPDTAFTLTRLKRVANDVPPVARYFTFEEYHGDIDQSELFTDCVVSSLNIAMAADDTVRATFGIVGRQFDAKTTGDSPVLTTPTQYLAQNLVATDAVILKDGVAVTDLTGFELTLDMGAATLPTIGATLSPDVFPNNSTLSGSFSLVRSDLTYLTAFADESILSLFFLLKEPEAEPADCIAVYVPYLKLMSAPDAPLGGDGAMISTVNWVAGKQPTATGKVEAMVTFSTSAA